MITWSSIFSEQLSSSTRRRGRSELSRLINPLHNVGATIKYSRETRGNPSRYHYIESKLTWLKLQDLFIPTNCNLLSARTESPRPNLRIMPD